MGPEGLFPPNRHEQLTQIVRKIGADLEPLTADRMIERQALGVQGLPVN
jgi:hypothetical protein